MNKLKNARQTPAHYEHNPDLLGIIPIDTRSIIEVGCSYGALAREYKKINPSCYYVGVDIDDSYTAIASDYCDICYNIDLEQADEAFWQKAGDRQGWIFGDTLEHFRDPWTILRKIVKVLPSDGYVAACVPNAQHWSVQARLSIGDFRYADSGLFDRTHLRWFTRQTLLELFQDCGLQIIEGHPRIFHEPQREDFLAVIEEMARVAGVDPQLAVQDSIPLQYVIRAIRA